MNTNTRKLMGLPPMPVNANYRNTPPLMGIFALYAFGIATGFGVSILTFTFCF